MSSLLLQFHGWLNSAPMWEEFISKATKLHSALKSALVAIAAFLDAFQKIADAATNARGKLYLSFTYFITSQYYTRCTTHCKAEIS
ncbi:hypothetical protein B5X24_HaOG208324 [Helicoverpa armigera]|nr:hypothetical protein B5X24_HaOG208324 [Helicoverpa armigera]